MVTVSEELISHPRQPAVEVLVSALEDQRVRQLGRSWLHGKSMGCSVWRVGFPRFLAVDVRQFSLARLLGGTKMEEPE